jgi:hypothetical protein
MMNPAINQPLRTEPGKSCKELRELGAIRLDMRTKGFVPLADARPVQPEHGTMRAGVKVAGGDAKAHMAS